MFQGKSFRTHDENSSNILNGLVDRGTISLSSEFPSPVNAKVRYTFEITADVTDNNSTKTNTGQSFVDGDIITWTGQRWLLLGNIEDLGGGTPGPTGATGPSVYVNSDPPPTPPGETGQLWWDIDDENGETYPESYETISKNLKGKPYAIIYNGDDIDTITYDLGGGLSIVKTFNYTTGILTGITLSGDIPAGINSTKILNYTGEILTSVTYS